MTTVNASITSVFNAEPQALYTITDPLENGVPQFVAGEASVVVTFDSATGIRGTDVEIDGATGQITLQGDISYSVTARVDTTSKTPTLFALQETSSGNIFGNPVPAGETMTALLSPAEENAYQIIAYTANGSRFQYPDSLINAVLTVQAVYGFEVA